MMLLLLFGQCGSVQKSSFEMCISYITFNVAKIDLFAYKDKMKISTPDNKIQHKFSFQEIYVKANTETIVSLH